MGPQNGIISDSFGIDLPQSDVDPNALNEVKNAAKFSKTKEFRELKKHLEGRIEFYQTYLPDGVPVVGMTKSMSELGEGWVVANALIGEFKAIIQAYERAAELVKDEAAK